MSRDQPTQPAPASGLDVTTGAGQAGPGKQPTKEET
jgi:hypothetical protein